MWYFLDEHYILTASTSLEFKLTFPMKKYDLCLEYFNRYFMNERIKRFMFDKQNKTFTNSRVQ